MFMVKNYKLTKGRVCLLNFEIFALAKIVDLTRNIAV